MGSSGPAVTQLNGFTYKGEILYTKRHPGCMLVDRSHKATVRRWPLTAKDRGLGTPDLSTLNFGLLSPEPAVPELQTEHTNAGY